MDSTEQFYAAFKQLQQQVNLLNEKVSFLVKENELLRYSFLNRSNELGSTVITETTDIENEVAKTLEAAAIAELSPPEMPPVPITVEMFRQTPIESSKQMHEKMCAALKPDFYYNIKPRNLYDIINVLVFIHNTPNATIMQLRTTSNLSVSGFAKQMARLKEKGYLLKEGTKTMVLTQKSIDMMFKALVENTTF